MIARKQKGTNMTDRAGDTAPAASTARSWWAAWAAYAACSWALVFAAVHLYWVLGGTVGLPPGLSLLSNTPLLVVDLLAIPLCIIAAVLALALVRAWGRWFPRWMLLTAAWGTSALFVVHALPSVVDDVVLGLGLRMEELTLMDRYILFLYEPWFLVGGVLFGAAAWSFTRRSR